MDALKAVLAHKLGLTPPEPDTSVDVAAPTPMRQMRPALSRAADKAVGLSASVLGIAEETLEAEVLIETGPEDWVVIGLRDGANAGLTGLFLINPALRSALVEMQTMGNLLPPRARGTQSNAHRCDPVGSLCNPAVGQTGRGWFGRDILDPAAYDMGPMDDLRTAGLVMMQGSYQSWRITVQLGGGDRQGEILIAMRPQIMTAPATTDAAPKWSEALRDALQDAPADLEAVLSRMTLPMSKIEEFEVGQ